MSKLTNKDLIDSLNKQIFIKDALISSLQLQNQKLIKDSNFKTTEDKLADYWNNRWPKGEIIYNAKTKEGMTYKYDVRNFIYNKSYILEGSEVIQGLKSQNLDHDNMALAVLRWIGINIKYEGDLQHQATPEEWQDPEFTIQEKVGDCEDGSLLIASLLRCLGIPAYKIKCYTGYVQDPNDVSSKIGHCFALYLCDDNKWYILDWCYYFEESLNNFKRLQHKNNPKYEDVWFSFNDVFSWKTPDESIE